VQEKQIVRFGPYQFEPHNAQLHRGTRVLPLTRKACEVLQCLVAQPGQLVTKEALFAAVWPEMAVSDGVLTNCITELRQALSDDARRPRFIATVHRRGYRFVAPLSPPAPAVSPAAPAPDLVAEPDSRPLPASLPPFQLGPSPLVGREAELAHLHRLYTDALHGQRHIVFVTGEAGIGKTAVVEAFVQRLGHDPELWIGHGQCIEQYGAGEAYLPLLEALGRLCWGPGGERLVALLAQYAPNWVVQLPGLLSASALADLQPTLVGTTRARMLRELAEGLEALSAERPLVLVLEDLHWSDASTVEALALLARWREPARLLVLGTYRPVDLIVHDHPLKRLKQELAAHGQCVEVPLSELSRQAVAVYVEQRGVALEASAGVSALVYRRTEGHPLFMVHMLDYLAHQDLLRAPDQGAAGGAAERTLDEAVPPGLRQLLDAQVERLAAEEQQVLEAGSVAGVEFVVASVAAGVPTTSEALEAVCERLARQGQFLEDRGLAAWPDGTVSGRYGFRHALYQEVVYQRLSAGRRARCHRLIGSREEAGYGAQASERAAELAVHFERGRDYQRAVQYLQQAAENAARRHAPHEAIALLTQALTVLTTLPETRERVQREVEMLIALGAALIATKGQGDPEVAQTYTRARQLCHHLDEPHHLFPTLRGLWHYYHVRAELQTAHALGEQLLTLAQQGHETAMRMAAHRALGTTLFMLGAVAAAHTHFAQAIALYDAHQHRAAALLYGEDVGVTSRSRDSWTLWYLGYPDQALARSQEAVTLAHQLAHPLSLSFAWGEAAVFYQFRRERQAAQEYAEAALHLTTEQGFPHWRAYGAILHGWALAHQGEAEAGMALLHEGLRARQATGAMLARPYFLSLLVEAYGAAGQSAAGLTVLTEACTLAETSGECWYVPELYRLKGTLLLQQSPDHHVEAEVCFQQAIRIAQSQQAKSLELRAATSLARLWQQQGKRTEAYALLAPVYGWFTEGFDTADLQEARALMEALA
jgi:predicted ATPase/DNA-binding winged helix-turn-helix (wHTH) protein